MDFGFTDDQREIQRTARDLLAERAKPDARARARRGAHRPTRRCGSELCELGWPGIAISEEYGGGGLGRIELSILCEELGRSLAPVPFLPSAMAATMIEHAGSAEQRERWLPGLATGETFGALGSASDGTAELVIGAPRGGVIVLVEADGRAGVVVAAEDAEVTPLESIDPTRSAARVSARGQARSSPAMCAGGIDRALVAVSSELVGVCDRALEMTVAYVKDRKQFGVPVGAFQAVSHRCAQMLLETEKARATTAHRRVDAPTPTRRAWPRRRRWRRPPPRKRRREVTAGAIQAHGGIGFTWEADVHWLYKRAQLDAALLGGAAAQRARLAAILADRVGASAPA